MLHLERKGGMKKNWEERASDCDEDLTIFALKQKLESKDFLLQESCAVRKWPTLSLCAVGTSVVGIHFQAALAVRTVHDWRGWTVMQWLTLWSGICLSCGVVWSEAGHLICWFWGLFGEALLDSYHICFLCIAQGQLVGTSEWPTFKLPVLGCEAHGRGYVPHRS